MKNNIFAVERNVRGAWVIYGALGVRQYYGYTRAAAIEAYRKGCREKIVEEQKK